MTNPDHRVEPRYNRQALVDLVGEEGQRALFRGRVALVGVGALGCAIADQLVRAGLGYLRLIDPDIPELSNLQRQSLVNEDDVRRRTPKAEAAAAKLRVANSTVELETRVERLEESTAAALLSDVDIVLDGTDNFESRYLINRTCLASRTPWVFGGVLAASGMSLPIIEGGPCLVCAIGPEPPPGGVPTTAERGVLAPVVNSIGSLSVIRGMKILMGRPVETQLIVFDLDRESFRTIAVKRNPSCPACGDFY